MKNIVILGSTGSIGENALRVVAHLSAELRVVGLAAGRRARRLAEQAAAFDCRWAAVADAGCVAELRQALPAGCRVAAGRDELCELVCAPEVDLVLCAIVGTAGLMPVLAAVRAGKTIALASKEVLVMAGEQVMAAARRSGARILPVDSEHSAVFQCLDGRRAADVKRLLLTASGGPFRRTPAADLARVTPEAALAHPTWNMGAKITIDSATLMNKGLEIIEAHWLFDLAPDRIEVVIHPQSIVHSMVEFSDGSILAQLGNPDMRLPIQYALMYPERRPGPVSGLDFSIARSLEFEPPDQARFPALRLARQALDAGGTAPAVFNAANEVAVARFLDRAIPFPGIWATVEAALARHVPVAHPTLEALLDADAWARRTAASAGGVP
jgi:1-deoxy-D-xylulose-5-phosphate reductoisomerase